MTEFSLSPAGPLHVDGISAVLTALARAGLRRKDCCPAFASSHYVHHPDQIACTVALDGAGRVLGFQSLKRAGPANTQSVPPGWGVIGTHVCPTAARQGVGRALFAVTRRSSRAFLGLTPQWGFAMRRATPSTWPWGSNPTPPWTVHGAHGFGSPQGRRHDHPP